MGLFILIKKVLKYILIVSSLIFIKISIKFNGIENVLNKIDSSPFFLNLFKIKNQETLISYINYLYRKKIFSCLESSILVKKIYKERGSIKLQIGIYKSINSFNSHAWIEDNKKIIFANITNISNYKIIHSI